MSFFLFRMYRKNELNVSFLLSSKLLKEEANVTRFLSFVYLGKGAERLVLYTGKAGEERSYVTRFLSFVCLEKNEMNEFFLCVCVLKVTERRSHATGFFCHSCV